MAQTKITGRQSNINLTELADTPPSYTGEANKVLTVNGTEDGITFAVGGGGGAHFNSSPATTTVSGLTAELTANEGQAFGDAVFINSSGKAQLGDSDAIATSSCVALCTESVSIDGLADYLLQGFATKSTWTWTVGGLIYLSTTGTSTNTLTQTTPSAVDDVIQILGVATHATRIYFNPQLVQIELA